MPKAIQAMVLVWNDASDAMAGREADFRIGPLGPAGRGAVVENCQRRFDAGERIAWSVVALRADEAGV